MGKGKKPNRSYDRDGKSENEKIRALQKKIKEQAKELTRLKAELKTLNAAFQKSAAYMSSQSKPLKVEELIRAAEKNQTLEEAIKEAIPDEKIRAEREREDVREKWRKWRLENRNGNPEDSEV